MYCSHQHERSQVVLLFYLEAMLAELWWALLPETTTTSHHQSKAGGQQSMRLQQPEFLQGTIPVSHLPIPCQEHAVLQYRVMCRSILQHRKKRKVCAIGLHIAAHHEVHKPIFIGMLLMLCTCTL